MKKNWKEQLLQAQEELLRLKLENQQLKDRTAEAVEQARRDERVQIAKEILGGRG